MTMSEMKNMDAKTLKCRLDEGSAVLIDVREADEYAREHILGSRLVPLSAYDRHDFDREAGKAVVFHCRSGSRTQVNADRLLARGFDDAYQLEGGIEAWKKAGLPVHTDRRQPIELMRQVQIAAGLLVLLGVVLGAGLSPWFYALSGFVGAGLTFAGVTGFCGMARMLAAMPWNRRTLAPAA